MSTRGHTLWLTGLSGAGKTTSATALRELLANAGHTVVLIDGDDLRGGLSRDLGFSAADRDENVRRAGEISLLLNTQGVVVIVSLISPRASARAAVRERHESAHAPFAEVYLATPLSVCEARDPKALYRQARAGERHQMTGIDDPYEEPVAPDVRVSTESASPLDVAMTIARQLSLVAPQP